MIRIAVCDDEKSYLDLISYKIENCISSNFDIECEIFKYSSIDELQEKINEHDLDIVFLDIMVNETNSIDWLVENQLNFKSLPFIIMTAYPLETTNLSEIDCCYFLLKPRMTDELLLKAIKRSINVVTKSVQKVDVISFGKKNYALDIHDIVYIETFNNNIAIHTRDDRVVDVYSTLKEFSKKLTPNFLRCHKSFMINMNYISGYEPYNFVLTGGKKIPIPPKKYKAMVSTYRNYLLKL